MKKINNNFLVIFVLVSVVVSFGAGFLVAEKTGPSIDNVEGLKNKTTDNEADVDFSLFWDVWEVVQEKFVDRSDLDRQQMVYGAIEGMVESLGDPYSVFMKPVASKKFQDDISGSFSGIGAEIGMRDGVLTIIAPLKNTPAYNAGVLPGDKVLKIDDLSTADLSLDEAVNHIRGEKGSEVILLIARKDWDQAKDISIIRDDISIPIINYEIKEGNIAYVQLYSFTANLSEEFDKIAKQIKADKPKGIILDLRSNPGGYLEVAVSLASWFIPKGDVVAIEDFGNGEQDEYRSYGDGSLGGYQIVVLIDQGSASASEILAGALRDHLEIQLVGQKSFGKGSVQELEKLDGGSSVKVTVAKWLTPSGLSIQKDGITPDFEVEVTPEDVEAMIDAQLNKALELF